jgi:hypothetical protein
MAQGLLTIVEVMGIPAFLVGMWCVVLLLVSVLSGWSRLASHFPAREPAAGETLRMQSIKVGWADYNGCLTIHRTSEGIRLAVWPMFRIGHPPIFIPWEAIHNTRARQILWSKRVICEVGSPRVAKLELPMRLFQGELT